MIIKLEKIINFSSEDPAYPASNLLQKNSSPKPWKCEKPGEMMSYVIFKLSEPSVITGIDIGNYRCCVVIVTASTSDDPDSWIPLVNHEFMTNDEAANNKWKDQVQLFTKKEISPLALAKKFDRVKVTCMQSANRREKFGLTFVTFKTEVTVDLNIDVFGKFKMKKKEDDNANKGNGSWRDHCLRLFPTQKMNYRDELKEQVKENALENFNKRQEENREPKKRPLLEKLEAGLSDEVFGKKKEDKDESKIVKNENKNFNKPPVKRTPFGDVIVDDDSDDDDKKKIKNKNGINQGASTSKDKSADDDNDNDKNKKTVAKNLNKDSANKRDKIIDTDTDDDDDDDDRSGKKEKKNWTRLKNKVSDDEQSDSENKCSVCADKTSMKVCKNCHKLPRRDSSPAPPAKKAKVSKKSRKPFNKLMENVTFALSGYVNPQREEIRKKALKMGAKYIANPNTTDQKCSHLVCAFKNTPKSEQLKGHTKIISHIFIEECYDHKKRYPWRRYALSSKERKQPESEDEIEAGTQPGPYDQDTDPESNSDADY